MDGIIDILREVNLFLLFWLPLIVTLAVGFVTLAVGFVFYFLYEILEHRLYTLERSIDITNTLLVRQNINLNLISPQETISRIVRLRLSNEEFSQIHHSKKTKGEHETIDSHVEYLDSIQTYQNKESNDYIVGLRLAYLEDLNKIGFDDMETNIEECKIEYPFKQSKAEVILAKATIYDNKNT